MKTQKINQRKTEAINKLKDIILSANDIVFADYRGINVEQMTELRKKLKETESTFHVIKNRFTRIALKELGKPDAVDFLLGPTALTIVKKDVSPVAKILIEFSKNYSLKIKGGIVDGELIDEKQLNTISLLPGRDEIYAKLLGSLNAPITNLLYTLNAVAQKLVRTLQAVADKNAESK